METERDAPLTNAIPLIHAAYPRNAVKELERHLDVTPSTAKRIVQTGRAPGRLQSIFIRLLDEAISRRHAELERLLADLKGYDHVSMVARAKDRLAAPSDTHPPDSAGLDRRSEEPLTLAPSSPPPTHRGGEA